MRKQLLLTVFCLFYFYTYSQKLPDWFLSPPQSNDSLIFSIGISNPNMDKQTGLEQAEYRAIAIANILVGSKIMHEVICTNYEFANFSNNSHKESSNSSSMLTRSGIKTQEYIVLETFLTKYNETIVLIKSNKVNKTKKGCAVEIVSESEKDSSYFTVKNSLNIYVTDTLSKKTYFDILEWNDQRMLESSEYSFRSSTKEITKTKYSSPKYQLKYKDAISKQNEKNTIFKNFYTTTFSLNSGLWFAYINNIIQNIKVLSLLECESTQVSDIYDNNKDYSFELMARYTDSLAFGLGNCLVKNNNLELLLWGTNFKPYEIPANYDSANIVTNIWGDEFFSEEISSDRGFLGDGYKEQELKRINNLAYNFPDEYFNQNEIDNELLHSISKSIAQNYNPVTYFKSTANIASDIYFYSYKDYVTFNTYKSMGPFRNEYFKGYCQVQPVEKFLNDNKDTFSLWHSELIGIANSISSILKQEVLIKTQTAKESYINGEERYEAFYSKSIVEKIRIRPTVFQKMLNSNGDSLIISLAVSEKELSYLNLLQKDLLSKEYITHLDVKQLGKNIFISYDLNYDKDADLELYYNLNDTYFLKINEGSLIDNYLTQISPGKSKTIILDAEKVFGNIITDNIRFKLEIK